MMRLPRVLSTVLPALLLTALPRALSSAVIHVPADRPTIASALAAAMNGDEIVIACGTYNEHDLVLKPGITVRSASASPDCVIIDGQRTGFRVMRGGSVHGLILEGLTIANGGRREFGFPRQHFVGGGLLLASSQSVAIRNCAFVRNEARYGGGVYPVNTHLTLTDCSFRENTAWRGSAIAAHGSGTLSVTGCEFKFSGATQGGYGFAAIDLYVPATIAASVLSENAGTIMVWGDNLLVTDSRFHRNAGGDLLYYPDQMFSFTDSQVMFQRCVLDSGVLDSYQASFVVANSSLTLESCTLHSETSSSRLISASGTSHVNVTNTILSSIEVPVIVSCGGGGVITLTCSNLWAPSGAEFSTGCDPETSGVIRADPLFCNAKVGDFHVASNSPCLPSGSPCGELIGALGEGCGPVSVAPLSWGRIKNLYR